MKHKVIFVFSLVVFVSIFLIGYSIVYSNFYEFINYHIPSNFPRWTGILVCCMGALIGTSWMFSILGDILKGKEKSFLLYDYLIYITIFCWFIAVTAILADILLLLGLFIENLSFVKSFNVFIKKLPDIYEISEKYLKIRILKIWQ